MELASLPLAGVRMPASGASMSPYVLRSASKDTRIARAGAPSRGETCEVSEWSGWSVSLKKSHVLLLSESVLTDKILAMATSKVSKLVLWRRPSKHILPYRPYSLVAARLW